MSNEIIEKMAKDTGCPSRLPCEECLLYNECDRRVFAKRLYDKDYRQQSEGEWIWIENGEADCEKYWVCSVCKEHDFVKSNFCPNCGAKMKGGE